jgi:glycosyltransferase involved in cell wall biosynthesis
MAADRKIKILMLPRYGIAGPSSRYRFFQFASLIEGCGYTCHISPLFSDKYITSFYSSGKKNRFEALMGILKRLAVIYKAFVYDLIIIEYEMLPYFPPLFERILKLAGRKYIADFDDAIYARYSYHSCLLVRWLLGKKIDRVIEYASAVTVANNSLLEYVNVINSRVFLLPTVVSAARYDSEPAPDHKDGFTVGWIGSPTSSIYLLSLNAVFRVLCQKGIRVSLIGTGIREMQALKGYGIEYIDWNEETEIREIKKFSVGIMPLTDDSWSKGKSGFKLVQYMACRLPVIASPVGANLEIVDDGETGMLVNTDEEWIKAVLYLAENPTAAEAMGEKGYRKFREKYSLEAVNSRYIEVVKLAMK